MPSREEDDSREFIQDIEWLPGETTKDVVLMRATNPRLNGLVRRYYLPGDPYVINRRYRHAYYPVPATITKQDAYDIAVGKYIMPVKQSEGGFVPDADYDAYVAEGQNYIQQCCQIAKDTEAQILAENPNYKVGSGAYNRKLDTELNKNYAAPIATMEAMNLKENLVTKRDFKKLRKPNPLLKEVEVPE